MAATQEQQADFLPNQHHRNILTYLIKSFINCDNFRPTTLNNNSYQNAIYVQKHQFYNNVNKFAPSTQQNLSRSGGLLDTYGTIIGSQPTMLHNKSVHHNILTSSDTNLSKLFDRVHSSDESVCSSSSRDLNSSQQQQQQQQPSSLYQPLYSSTQRELNKSTSGSNKQLNIWSDFSRQPQTQQQLQQQYNDVISTSHNNNGSGLIPKKQQRGHKDGADRDEIEIVKAKPYNIQQNWYVDSETREIFFKKI